MAAGSAVGWAYQREFLDWGRTGAAWAVGFGGILAASLLPSEIIGLIWGPFPDVTNVRTFFAAVPLALTPVPVAVVASWALRRGASIGWPLVVAALVLNFMIAGSVAQFGGRGVTFLLFAGFVVFEILAGFALWWLQTRLDTSRSEPRIQGTRPNRSG